MKCGPRQCFHICGPFITKRLPTRDINDKKSPISLIFFSDYNYNEDTGSCYKFHLKPLTWKNAEEACEAEQAYLAIPNSLKEANYLANVTAMAPKQNISGWYLRGAVHLGFRYDERYNDWMTIRGNKIE